MNLKKNISIFFLFALTSCGSLPNHEISRTNVIPSIVIIGAPEGSQLLIDGIFIRNISDEKTKISVSVGLHRIEIKNNNFQVFTSEVYAGETAILEVDVTQRITRN